MRKPSIFVFVIIAISVNLLAQDQRQDPPVSIISQKWERIRIAGEKFDNGVVPPVRSVTGANKVYQRSARENQPKGSVDPNETTIDGRSAALERTVQDARTPTVADQDGFRYSATVKNNSDRRLEVIFWEYRFKEIAVPSNTVHRQFVCSVKLKPGKDIELYALSSLGPSETISVESLSNLTRNLFNETVFINRMEFADDAILQRQDWKMSEIKASLDKAVATPWGKEICRPL